MQSAQQSYDRVASGQVNLHHTVDVLRAELRSHGIRRLSAGFGSDGLWLSARSRKYWSKARTLVLAGVHLMAWMRLRPLERAFYRYAAVSQVRSALDTRRAVLAILVPNSLDVLAQFTVGPIIPVFVVTTLGGDAQTVALVLSTAALGQTISASYMGRLSDEIGRKLMIVIGIGGSLLGHLCCGLAPWVGPLLGWSALQLFVLGRFMWGLFGATEFVSSAFLVDVCPQHQLTKASTELAMGHSSASIVGPLLGAGVLSLTGSSEHPFLVAAAIAGFGLAVAAAFQLSTGDVSFLELTRSSAIKRETLISRSRQCGSSGRGATATFGGAMHRQGGVISEERAERIVKALDGAFDENDMTRGRATMIAATTAAFFCIRASLVAGLAILPIHLMAVVPNFSGSLFGIVVSVQSLVGLLAVRATTTRLQSELGTLAANALLALLLALSSMCAAAMSAELGELNWLLLLAYCVCFGPAISGHTALGPPALARWATPEMRGFVISLGALASASSHIIMPIVFSSLFEATSASFVFAANAALAALGGALFYLMHLAVGAPGLPARRMARGVCCCLPDDDAIFAARDAIGTEHEQSASSYEWTTDESFVRTLSRARDASPAAGRLGRGASPSALMV